MAQATMRTQIAQIQTIVCGDGVFRKAMDETQENPNFYRDFDRCRLGGF